MQRQKSNPEFMDMNDVVGQKLIYGKKCKKEKTETLIMRNKTKNAQIRTFNCSEVIFIEGFIIRLRKYLYYWSHLQFFPRRLHLLGW